MFMNIGYSPDTGQAQVLSLAQPRVGAGRASNQHRLSDQSGQELLFGHSCRNFEIKQLKKKKHQGPKDKYLLRKFLEIPFNSVETVWT